mgnify:FL=1
MNKNIPQQKPNEVVYTKDWDSGQLSYEEGAREKSTVYSPERSEYEFLKSDHMYLSKKSNKRYPVQFWMEIVAYRLGSICGVTVPPAFVSIDKDDVCRALSEWFYTEKNTGDHFESYITGYLLLKEFDEKLDKKYGTRHCLPLLIKYLEFWGDNGSIRPVMIESFFRCFVFDALIANTDRHHENWGMIFRKKGDQYSGGISPAFDNGTSLGHNYVEEKLDALLENKDWLNKYVSDGYHHLRKEPEGDNYKHTELIEHLISVYPYLIEVLQELLSFDMECVGIMLKELTEFEVPVKFTKERARFTYAIIEAKREALQKVLNDVCEE